MAAGGPEAVAHARRQLARVDQVTLDQTLLDAAAALLPGSVVRSLDAIHLASAQAAGAELRSVVTYDQRMAAAAVSIGLVAEAPS